MADTPVFDPKNALGSGLGKLTKEELLSLVKRLCEISAGQCGENGFRGGFRPGNIAITESGVVVGPADKAGEDGWTKDELEYMAPEVFWNGAKTSRADVYSIGLILFVGLNCGNVPFVPMADYKPTPEVRANALRTRMNGEKIDVHKVAEAPLAEIVEKAIAFEVSERYTDALEFLNALRTYCGEEPVKEIKKEAAPVVKAAPEKPAQEVKPEVKPEPVKTETPKEKAEPAKEKADEVKAEPVKEEPPKKRRKHPIVTAYQIKTRRVKFVTLLIIVLLLCGTAYASEHADAIDLSSISISKVLPTPKPEPTPEPTATPEPTPEPTATPEPTPEPTPAAPIYELIVEDISWDKAEQKCREMGGHLVTISSADDYAAVCDMLKSANVKYVWIGCYRNNADILTWTSGAETDFYKWASGEPSVVDKYDGANEDYLMLVRQADGSWLYNDNRMDPMADYARYYSGKIAYICQHG